MVLGFAFEYSLGHVTHAENLKAVLAGEAGVHPRYVDLAFHGTPGLWARLPGVRSNWSLRASLGAYLGMRRHTACLNAAFYHTQVTSLLSCGLMRRVPTVVSLDATPLQIDALGAAYGHVPSTSHALEAVKKRLNERAFRHARHLVSWSQWAKDSLVADYGVPSDKVTVIPPGIDSSQWGAVGRTERRSGSVNLLFVGGDFRRKGGDALLTAFRQLPAGLHAHLHLVTQAEGVGDGLANVTVHRHLAPNSPPLRRLFAEADLFVLPTFGDCLPLAVLEALAAGLPVITTNVGAMPEAVSHGDSGLIVPAADVDALSEAIARLAADPGTRARFAGQARAVGRERFDAATNYARLIGLVKGIAH